MIAKIKSIWNTLRGIVIVLFAALLIYTYCLALVKVVYVALRWIYATPW